MNKWNQYHIIPGDSKVSFFISYLEVTIGLWKDHFII